MIGKITGRVDYKAVDHVLVDVQGVGYLVYCSERTLSALPAKGGIVALYTDLLVREDNLQLFGFLTLGEKEWHRLLTSVQGVGAKVGLAIAGTLGVDGVSRAITLGDVAAVKAAPGVGPKLAQRIVVELKDKAASVIAMGAQGAEVVEADDDVVIDPPMTTPPAAQGNATPSSGVAAAGAQADALSALVNLGYGHGDAASAVAKASGDMPSADSGALIKAALRLLAPKG
ncbi:Holliday junction branch migration protein RuvA [Amylibacter sp. IMCC11727]|uniref:Holliday junction branch migration protein RuvA n=1 Tax=Amylibacter sp. IMCC11727 TaxID=3039851 RepID=UPI00244E36DE|nr:Holliday junction branch migration protein RuvA [Amylibacter sp. IMCC11727]WGI22829.1 Holliday junction branch migration protein RuvA [Amylibacter sp. IMCC11727]